MNNIYKEICDDNTLIFKRVIASQQSQNQKSLLGVNCGVDGLMGTAGGVATPN